MIFASRWSKLSEEFMRSLPVVFFSVLIVSLAIAAPTPEFQGDLGSGKTPWGTLHVYDRLKPTKAVPPHFPPEARRSGISGTVHAMVLVAADGTVADVKIRQSSGNRALDDAGVAALKLWKYPASATSERVMSLQPVVFALTGTK